jgi:dTDP-4-dehydrorhamnose reductase
MKSVCVIGSGGMLGYAVGGYFASKGWSIKKISRTLYDIAKEPIESLVPLIKDADLVINCAGVIKPRIAQLSVEEVLKVNSIFPHNLALIANSLSVPAIHVTTDCIYSGSTGNYNELSPIDAQDVYGLSKAAGDTRTIMTLRTSIIGEEPEGQSRSLIEWVRKQNGQTLNGFLNHKWNGLTTWYLATVIEAVFDKGHYKAGISHIHSPRPLNKFELVSHIAEVYGVRAEIKPVDAPEFCDRTLSSIHDLSADLCTMEIPEQISKSKEFFSTLRSRQS